MRTEAPNPNTIVWFNNKFVPLAEANVNILTHALNYGTGVFEGIRGYFEEKQKDLFWCGRWSITNAGNATRRFYALESRSALSIWPNSPPSCAAAISFKRTFTCWPLAYKCSARIGVAPDRNDAYALVVLPFGDYFESANGLKAGVVSWRRIEDTAIPGRAKICGAYVNSVLATDEARQNGHDEAIFLTESGHVAEGATCNLFMVRNGMLVTPPSTDNILEGITRASVMELARREMKLEVVERSIGRSELYVSDEVFFTGTAVEIAPVVQVDHRPVGRGEVGPVATKLRSLYIEATRGRMAAYRNWLWPVYRPAIADKAA